MKSVFTCVYLLSLPLRPVQSTVCASQGRHLHFCGICTRPGVDTVKR